MRSAAEGPGPAPKALRSRASAYRTAVSTARSKGPVRPSASALRRAPAKTFSKTYGTPSTKVGRKAARSGSNSAAASTGWWPSFTRARTAATSTIRPNTCASGRKSRVDGSSPCRAWKTDSQRLTRVSVSYMKLACVSTHPFGRPVVPEV